MTLALDPKIIEHLDANGWKLSEGVFKLNSADAMWYRKFRDVEPRCYGNDHSGVQIVINGYDQRKYGPEHQYWSFQIDLTAEPDDGEWVCLKAYGINECDLIAKLDAQCEKLIRAWKACQKHENESA
jgi:hypothetical protein